MGRPGVTAGPLQDSLADPKAIAGAPVKVRTLKQPLLHLGPRPGPFTTMFICTIAHFIRDVKGPALTFRPQFGHYRS
jgi:hypothetical protein